MPSRPSWTRAQFELRRRADRSHDVRQFFDYLPRAGGSSFRRICAPETAAYRQDNRARLDSQLQQQVEDAE
jgi:hypothetical protein